MLKARKRMASVETWRERQKPQALSRQNTKFSLSLGGDVILGPIPSQEGGGGAKVVPANGENFSKFSCLSGCSWESKGSQLSLEAVKAHTRPRSSAGHQAYIDSMSGSQLKMMALNPEVPGQKHTTQQRKGEVHYVIRKYKCSGLFSRKEREELNRNPVTGAVSGEQGKETGSLILERLQPSSRRSRSRSKWTRRTLKLLYEIARKCLGKRTSSSSGRVKLLKARVRACELQARERHQQ